MSDYRPVLSCALVYGTAVVLARFAFEDGSNAATVGPLRTGLVMNLEPIAAICGSWLLLGQGLAPAQLAGSALVIAGVVGAQISRRPAPAAR